jgi:hypothetical protein
MTMVDMLVVDDLLDQLPDVVLLMKAREVAHRPSGEPGVTAVTLVVDGAPDHAIGVTPDLQWTPNGVRVTGMNWQFAH